MLKDLEEMVKVFKQNYAYLYEKEEYDDNVHAQVNNLAEEYDRLLQDDDFAFLLRLFNNYRKDFITSDREAAAYMLTRQQLVLS